MGIDWGDICDGTFVKLENGVAKRLVLKNWQPQTKFKDEKTGELRKGVVFEVWGEDDRVFTETGKKEWTVTAIRALSKLRPLCEAAEKAGQSEIVVSVVRAGEGKSTIYEILPCA